MPRMVELQTGFTAGELDPKIRAQSDLKIYGQGLAKMRDLARLVGGGVERRAGTIDVVNLTNKCRLIDFEFSSTQRYLVALDEGRARVFDLEGDLIETVNGCPWTAATLFELSYSQSADVMVLSHNAFLWELRRTGASVFTATAFEFLKSMDNKKVYQPYYKFADDVVTMTPSAPAGDITLTASGTEDWGGFVAGHVDQRFRIYDAEIRIKQVISSTVAEGEVRGKLEGKLDLDAFKSKKGSLVIEVLHLFHGLATGGSVTFSGANDIGQNIEGEFGITGAQLTGTFVVTVEDEHTYTFNASGGEAAVSEDGGGPNIKFSVGGLATRRWLEPSINSVRGFPASACFHEGRLWLGGTSAQPDGYWGSDALQHRRFDVGKGYDGQSVQGAAGLEGLSSIRHLISNGDLQVFTPTTEGVFVSEDNKPITPSSQRVERQSVAGSGYVMPQVFDGATLFVQEHGLSVSEMVYQDAISKYAAIPVSAIAQHFLESGIVDSAITGGTVSRAEQYAFFPTGDGSIAVFHSIRSENIAGWGKWTIANAHVHSICSVGTDIFMCVERLNDGQFRLYQLALEPSFYVLDGAREHTSVEDKSSWTLDLSLRSRRVELFCDRGYLGPVDVPPNGIITTSVRCKRLLAGDGFLFELETLPPRVEVPSGVRDRLRKRIVRAVIELDETDSLLINGLQLLTRQVGENLSMLPAPYTGPYTARALGFSPSPSVRITQEAPGFARILGMTLEVQI